MPITDGEDTKLARNDADHYEAEYEEENYNPLQSFRNGVIERIVELGYQGKKEDLSAVCNFICTKFKKNNITIESKGKPCTRAYINSWLKNSPADFGESRKHIYKLCFALEMNAEQTKIFFFKNYLCRPFNFKNTNEAVYYFCLNTGKTYAKAVELIDKIKALPEVTGAESIETRLMEIPLSEIKTEDDFLLYMIDHRYDKEAQHETVCKEIERLMADCKKLLNVKSNDALLEHILGYNERNVIVFDEKSGKDKVFGISNSELPNAIKINFPRPINFSQIKNRRAKDDTYRKMLIILCFYKYYSTLKNITIKNGISKNEVDLSGKKEEFEIMLDQLLDKCGYVQVYWQNPFDRFILLCTKQKDPLEELKWLLETYYLDIAAEKS